jgi:hypothetical protein
MCRLPDVADRSVRGFPQAFFAIATVNEHHRREG